MGPSDPVVVHRHELKVQRLYRRHGDVGRQRGTKTRDREVEELFGRHATSAFAAAVRVRANYCGANARERGAGRNVFVDDPRKVERRAPEPTYA